MFFKLNIPRIDKDLERTFTLEYNKRSIPFARFVFFVILFFLPFYYYLDYISGPESYVNLWIIRTFGLLLPSIAMFFISMWKKFYVYYQQVMTLFILWMSVAIILMVFSCHKHDLCFNFYFIGILTINSLTLVSRLKFKNAIFIYLTTTVLYFLTAILRQHLEGYFLYNDMLFFISVSTAFTLAHIFLESYMRNLFINERRLREANNELINQNQKIFQQNEELQILNSMLQEQKGQLEYLYKKVSDSIQYARRIQKAIMPKEEILKQTVSEYFIYFFPKDVVSGDFYWWTKNGDDFFLVAADCTGHGVPGAFMSMLGISLLEKIIITQGITRPSEIIHSLTSNLYALLKYGKDKIISDSIDLALIKLNTKTQKLYFSGIHINAIVLTSKQRVINHKKVRIYEAKGSFLYELHADNFQVGFHKTDNFTFTDIEMPFSPGDKIFVHSDGLTDQMNKSQHKLTRAKIRNEIVKYSEYPVKIIGGNIINLFENWKEDAPQTDDVLFIGIEL